MRDKVRKFRDEATSYFSLDGGSYSCGFTFLRSKEWKQDLLHGLLCLEGKTIRQLLSGIKIPLSGGLEGIFWWLLKVIDSGFYSLNGIFKLPQDSSFPRQCAFASPLSLSGGCLALKRKSIVASSMLSLCCLSEGSLVPCCKESQAPLWGWELDLCDWALLPLALWLTILLCFVLRQNCFCSLGWPWSSGNPPASASQVLAYELETLCPEWSTTLK